jgi:hypothetical protein
MPIFGGKKVTLEELETMIATHAAAINELGEREYQMTVEFDALKAAHEDLKTKVVAAATTVMTKVDALTKQVKDLNDELALPHEDVDGIVALTADVKATAEALVTQLTPKA